MKRAYVDVSDQEPAGVESTSHLARRSVLGAAAGIAFLGLQGCTGGGSSSSSALPTPKVPAKALDARADWPARNAVFMQVVAHPDDDLYFMNPGVLQAVRTGAPVTTVFLTCGEDDGRNVDGKDPSVLPDFEGYSTARQNGSRAAYAFMATGDRMAKWVRENKPTRGGAIAETDHLVNAPNVRLIWLNMRKTEEPQGGDRLRLRNLWNGEIETMQTMVPAGSSVGGPYRYTRDSLIGTLADLYHEFAPTLIRTLDIDPDFLKHGGAVNQHADHGNHADHQDHTASALFAWEAMKAYPGAKAPRHTLVESYRAYYNERWPHNLSSGALAEKKKIIDIYGWGDHFDCGDRYGCGDLKIGLKSTRGGWPQSTTVRYPGGVPWLQPTVDGRLTAFVVLDHGVGIRQERAPGSDDWTPPTVIAAEAGTNLAPQLGVTRSADGRFTVAALRAKLAADPNKQRRDIVVAEQKSPDGAFGSWTDLGTPSTADPDQVRGLGAPVLQTDGQGRVHLFVRNFAKGVSTRVRAADGTWGPWADLGGGEIQEGITSLVRADGRVEAFAATRTGLEHWVQGADGRVARAEPIAAKGIAGPPTAVLQADGKPVVFYREADTAKVMMLEQKAVDGAWPARAKKLNGHGGWGALAALGTREGKRPGLIVERNNEGGVSVAFQQGSRDGTVTWVPTGGVFAQAPAVAVDASGRIVLALTSADGTLATSRQQGPDGSASFGSWKFSA
jgi:LmbE family N-acetylglucosaminyl deacetylase